MNNLELDQSIELRPKETNHNRWLEVFGTALDDLTHLIAPKVIVFCEGKLNNSLDAKLWNKIFGDEKECLFVSATNNEELRRCVTMALRIIKKALKGVKLIGVIDGDGKEGRVEKENPKIVRLKRTEFENYLCDYEIFNKAFPTSER